MRFFRWLIAAFKIPTEQTYRITGKFWDGTGKEYAVDETVKAFNSESATCKVFRRKRGAISPQTVMEIVAENLDDKSAPLQPWRITL